MYSSRVLRSTVESPRAKHEDPQGYDYPTLEDSMCCGKSSRRNQVR